MDTQKLYKLRFYAEQLEKGIDPTSGIQFAEDTILNTYKIKEYNGEVRRLLDSLIIALENEGTRSNKHKIPFFMLKEEKEVFNYSNSPVSISEFCYKLNENISVGMNKLYPKDVTKGLEKLGYLETRNLEEDRTCKIPTKKGRNIGIIQEIRKNIYGNEYSVNLYTVNAQEFVLWNLEKILQMAKI